MATRRKARYAADRERVLAQNKAWKLANRDSYKEWQIKYSLENRERIAATAKAWAQANPERSNLIARRWRQANRERSRFVNKRHKHSEKGKIWKQQNHLRLSLGKALAKRLKAHGKSGSTMKLVGCDMEWLRAWLEVHFRPGMTWENYGPVWHVDHVKPCAAFDLSDPIQQRLCWHWTNLQPLFASENLSKGDKWK